MRIGLDFDNTIVCYDRLFHRLAQERGLLPPDLPATKLHVRDHLRRIGREDDWTELQGIAYGRRMAEAEAYPGALATLAALAAAGHELSIISHKTRQPFRGEPSDLHAAARIWVASNLVDCGVPLLPEAAVYFLPTKGEKIDRIAAVGCEVYLDDLPEILTAPNFPTTTCGILFDPDRHHPEAGQERVESWAGFHALLVGS